MTKTINDLLSKEEIASIRQPIEKALTLPSKAFTDQAFYDLEVENIYKKNWVATFFDTEIPNSGDIKPFFMCEIPLLAVRGNDNQVRVFHNLCPYDGSLAAIDPAQGVEKIATPYHGWEYNLEGKLIKTPYWDGTREGNLDVLAGKDVDLVAVNSNTFMNTVFINLSDTPESFDDYIAPVIRSASEYDLTKSVAGVNEFGDVHLVTGKVKTNWKTFCENACLNVLHENFVHALYDVSPEVPRIKEDTQASFENILDEKFMALAYNRQDFLKTYPPVEAPHLGKDPAVEPEVATFGTLYPNFYFSAASQFIEVGFVLPNGPEEVEQKAIYHMHEELAGLSPVVEGIADGFGGAFAEDARICENLQKGKKSPVYKQKFYAPFWDGMHHKFTNMVVDDLETA